MRIYRTCAPRTADIEHFLSSPEEIHAIQNLLPTQSMIDEVFSRLPSNNTSRFCPAQFTPVPLYASENDITTFYEYCFHLLLNKKFISGNKPINAVLYYLKLQGRPVIKDISKEKAKGLMAKNSYKKAHQFIAKLHPLPDVVKYKSIRDKNHNYNLAIFSKKSVAEDGVSAKRLIIGFLDKKSVEVFIDNKSYQISPYF
jgi:hypothetical protein